MAGRAEIEWSECTIPLGDIVPHIPTLVKVTEGIYQDNDAGSFSLGDLIRIDGYKQMKRVRAYLTQPGSTCQYEQEGEAISLPFHYSGKLQVLPIHGTYHEYHSMYDIIDYYPRKFRLQCQLSFTEPSGKSWTIPVGSVLEVKALRRAEDQTIQAVRCLWKDESVILPSTLRGVFQVLPDDKIQTIRDVVKDYKLPQCVRFLDDGVQKIMSRDIQEVIDNMESYSGQLLLDGVSRSVPALLGHYKGMYKDLNADVCRRSAVVIPLNVPEISEIPVQIPKNAKDSSDYESFLTKNFSNCSRFSESSACPLYVDFLKHVHFLSEDETTAPPVPRRLKDGGSSEMATESKAPPVPPKQKSLRSPSEPSVSTRFQISEPKDESLSETTGVKVLPLTYVTRPKQAFVFPSSQPKDGSQRSPTEYLRPVASVKPSPKMSAQPVQGTSAQPTQRTSAQPTQRTLAQPTQTLSAQPTQTTSARPTHRALAQPIQSTSVQPTLSTDKPVKMPPRPTPSKENEVPPGKAPRDPHQGNTDVKKRSTFYVSDPAREAFNFTIADGFQPELEQDIYEPTSFPDQQATYVKFKEKGKKAMKTLARKVSDIQTGLAEKFSHDHPKQEKPDMPTHDYDYIDDPDLQEQCRNRTERNRIPHQDAPFSKLTIAELESVLNECGMSDLAKTCKNEKLDGCILCSLKEETLTHKPFKLTNYHIQKLKKVMEGWRPMP